MEPIEAAVQRPPGRAASTYVEFLPPPALRQNVLCLWIQRIRADVPPYVHRVLPDACVDIVCIGDRAPVVAGPATATVQVPLEPGTRVLGARFKPGRAPAALGCPANEIVDREVPLADLWGRAATELAEWMHAQRSLEATWAVLEDALARSLADPRKTGQTIQRALSWLAAHPRGRVRDLADLLGMSSRQLQRDVVAAVGYGPKTFQRIVRFQGALAAAKRLNVARLDQAGLALEAGYADQAHLCRDLRQLGGLSAADLLGRVGSTLELSDLFNTPAIASAYR